jgi:addiction module RelE/StbE family toxin
MVYHIFLTHEAKKDLARIPKVREGLVLAALAALERDPHLGKPLTGPLKGLRSQRVWPYRIVYRIEQKRLVVFVVSIPHRKDAYR